MSFVLVKGAIIKCPHGGQLKLSSGDSRLSVDGSDAITVGMEAGLTFGAPNVPPTPDVVSPCSGQVQPPTTPPTFKPCVTSPATQGMATKLVVGTAAALLDNAAGTTITPQPQPPGQWTVVNAGQAKLEAV
jgi:hypothetical protein